jgi:hypothetical protein
MYRHNRPLFGSYYTSVVKTYATTNVLLIIAVYEKDFSNVNYTILQKYKNDRYNIAFMFENDRLVRAT